MGTGPVEPDEPASSRDGPPPGPHAHVLVDDLAQPALDDAAAHHLRRVRRLQVGDRLTMTDGSGRWAWARLGPGDAIELDGEVTAVAAPDPPITVAFALTKGGRPEWTVQKLTEVGVDRIVPFIAERSVVRWDDGKRARQHERMTAIARSALEQSGRCRLPAVDPVVSVADVAALGAVRMEQGHAALELAQNVVAVGPEGGWSDTEREILATTASIGPHTLRAETAAITTGAILVALRSGLVASPRKKFDGA